MATPVADTFNCRIVVKGLGKSWTEEYPLGDGGGSRAAAVLIGIDLCKVRRLILANNFTLHYAAIHDGDDIPDRSLVINKPVSGFNLDTEAGPPVALEDCHDVKSALHITYETADGKWVNRLIGGLRDSWIEANDLAFTPTLFAVNGYVAATHGVAGQTKEAALGSFMAFCRDKVRLHHQATKTTVDILNLPNVFLRGVTARDRGASAFGGRGRAKVLANV